MNLDLLNSILLTVFASFLVNGIITLLDKLSVLEWVQGNGNKFFSKMFSCHFCLAHHLSLLFVLPMFFIGGNWFDLFVPLSVAGIITLVK